jgi:hypothetical protein
MVDILRDWPEYQEILDYLQGKEQEILDYLRGKGVDVDPYIELLRTLYSLSWRGNVFNDWKCNRLSLCLCTQMHKIS